MRGLRNAFLLLPVLGYLAMGLAAHAQPKDPPGKIPADIPAKVRTEIQKLRSSDKRERAEAMMSLRYMAMRGEAAPAVPFLMQLLGSDAEFPEMIVGVSPSLPTTASCSPGYTFGGQAAETLARMGKISDALLSLTGHPEWRVRANAVRALGGLKDPRAVDPLLAALAKKGEHPEVKGNAAIALGSLRVQRAVAPLIAALKHSDPMVRGAAASALGQLGDPRALPPLIAALADDDAHVRMQITGSLGRMGGPTVLNPLLGALKDDDRQVREVAACALRHARDPRVVGPLIAALDDPYSNVRINAAGALGEIEDPEAVGPLIALLTDDNQSVRGAAATALGKQEDSRAVEPLIEMVLKEDRWEIPRTRGLAALVKLGYPGAKEALEESRRHRTGEWWRENGEEFLRGR